MINKYVLVVHLLFFTLVSLAQESYNSKNMVVSKADLNRMVYSKDTTANALYLYEKGYSRIQDGGSYDILTDYSAKIKILTEQGYEKAIIEIPLYKKNKSSKEKIKNIVAHTYTYENNQIKKVTLDKDQIFFNEYDENHTLVTFTLPNLKPGCVITYSYQTSSPFVWRFREWEFQDDIPKIYSEYTTDIPGNYIYNTRIRGPLKLKTNESSIKKGCIKVSGGGKADCSHNVYAMENIPAFIEEDYMTAKKNYFSKIAYELSEFKGFDGSHKKYTKTWKDADKELKEDPNFGQLLKKNALVKDVLPQEISLLPNSLDKAKRIYHYLTKNYVFNGDLYVLRKVDLKNAIKTKSGNISEINLLLYNVLRQQGFSVQPVLSATRNNGYIVKIHPVISDFNYLLVQLNIDTTSYLLDASISTLPFGNVPFRCLNQYGRLMDFKNGSSWVDIKPKMRSYYYFKEKMILQPDNQILCDAIFAYGGYHGYFRRNQMAKKQKYIERIKKVNPDIEITKIDIKNQYDLPAPFVEEVLFTRYPDDIEDILYINPFSNPFFKENPFKLNQRTYPIDFGYQDSYTYQITFEIPENYSFEDIPEDTSFGLPNNGGTLHLSAKANNKVLTINYRISFSSDYYPKDYYESLKIFFNKIVTIENNSVIAIKKGL
ncbi:hypothetical protein ABW636_11920 [Aquimarina sp. 2201CG1-2-11]|uniref:hypothetical protein n=1 Tax=Aquimarina discodermiae TaxID=3231043 RepID=UPI003462D177